MKSDSERDFYMGAEEAKAYGLIDNVISNRGDLVSPEIIAAQAAASK